MDQTQFFEVFEVNILLKAPEVGSWTAFEYTKPETSNPCLVLMLRALFKAMTS